MREEERGIINGEDYAEITVANRTIFSYLENYNP